MDTDMARARTLEQAAAFVDKVGIALVFGKADLVLPSLWDAVCGPGADWAVRDENGKAIAFTPDFDRLWHWKDDLPDRRLACAGRHLARDAAARSEEHTSELQSRPHLVCRLLLEKKN